MEEALFARLWEEVDFDDHPHQGGHGPVPEGELRFSVGDEAITIGDDRLTFRLGLGDDGEDSIHRWTMWSVHMNEGAQRLGEHRWSLSPDELGGQLTRFVNGCIGRIFTTALCQKFTGDDTVHLEALIDKLQGQVARAAAYI